MFITWTFDRAQGTLVRRSKTIFGVKAIESTLSDIVEAQVTRMRNPRGGGSFCVEQKLKDRTSIPLGSWRSLGYKDKARAVVVINEFLQRQ